MRFWKCLVMAVLSVIMSLGVMGVIMVLHSINPDIQTLSEVCKSFRIEFLLIGSGIFAWILLNVFRSKWKRPSNEMDKKIYG